MIIQVLEISNILLFIIYNILLHSNNLETILYIDEAKYLMYEMGKIILIITFKMYVKKKCIKKFEKYIKKEQSGILKFFIIFYCIIIEKILYIDVAK